MIGGHAYINTNIVTSTQLLLAIAPFQEASKEIISPENKANTE